MNTITVRDTYPLPRTDECIDSLGDDSVFTTLYCISGYWQIPLVSTATLREDDIDLPCRDISLQAYAVRAYQRIADVSATFGYCVELLQMDEWLVYFGDVVNLQFESNCKTCWHHGGSTAHGINHST